MLVEEKVPEIFIFIDFSIGKFFEKMLVKKVPLDHSNLNSGGEGANLKALNTLRSGNFNFQKKYNAISRCARLVSLSYNPFPKNLNFLRATRVTTLHSRNTKNHSTVATCQPIHPSPSSHHPPLPLPTPLKLGPNRAHSPHP